MERERYLEFARERFLRNEDEINRLVEERRNELGPIDIDQRNMIILAYRQDLEYRFALSFEREYERL